MSSPTPGPWDYDTDGFEWGLGVFSGETCVCRMDWPETTKGRHEANARLIAAAPDLLEAAKQLKQLFLDNLLDDATDEENRILDFADAAIDKAEGSE